MSCQLHCGFDHGHGRTRVERFELVACGFRALHSVEQRSNAGVILAPKIVRD